MATLFLVKDGIFAGPTLPFAGMMEDGFTIWPPIYCERPRDHRFVGVSPWCRWELFEQVRFKGDGTSDAVDGISWCLSLSFGGYMVQQMIGWGFCSSTAVVPTAKTMFLSTFEGMSIVSRGLEQA